MLKVADMMSNLAYEMIEKEKAENERE